MICNTQTKTFFALSIVALATLVFCAGSVQAELVSELGVLDLNIANGGINPATGNPWQLGDTYRLAFVTDGTRDATSPDIADYHAFVQTQADNAGLGGATWLDIGQSYNDPTRDVNANLSGTGVGIFLLDSTKLADDNNDLKNGPDVTFDLTELGNTWNGAVATGSSRKFGDPGQTKIEHGVSWATDGRWWQQYNGNQTSQWHFYAISDPLAVMEAPAVPEPSMFVLGAMGLLGLACCRRRKR